MNEFLEYDFLLSSSMIVSKSLIAYFCLNEGDSYH
jgi:hypothetical protein